MPDALSQIYSNDVAGTVCTSTEYVQLAEVSFDLSVCALVLMPVLVGVKTRALAVALRKSAQIASLDLVLSDSAPKPLGIGHGETPAIKKWQCKGLTVPPAQDTAHTLLIPAVKS